MADFSLNPESRQSGEKQKSGKPLSFKCPNCSGSITVKALGHSITAVCAYCSSVIDVANENYQLLRTEHEKTRATLLTIGSKGALFGVAWEVIGYMEKHDHTDYNLWDEYLLYNPYHGFRFLVQSNGHWSFYKVLKQSLGNQALSSEIRLNGQKYELFLKGFAKVSYVIGEFYWRVQTGDRTRVYDYIAPPYLLSIAVDEEEINLAQGVYVNPKLIAKGFSITQMPSQSGIAANQPGKYRKQDIWSSWATALAAILLLLVVQLASQGLDKNKTVVNGFSTLTAAGTNLTLISDPFTIPRQTSLQIVSNAPIENDWLELELALVDDKDQEIRVAKQAIEFYSGYSYDDGHWSEGEKSSETFFSGIPKGNYRLLIDADGGSLHSGARIDLTYTITYGVKSWANYWFTFLLILLYPLYVSFRYKITEWRRWSQSDLPYDTPLTDED